MAITLQLVRLDKDTLDRCIKNESAFIELISYTLLPDNNYIDLCWAAAGLCVLARLSGQCYEAQSALSIACNGVRPIHLNLDETWEQSFLLNPDEVKLVCSGLLLIDISKTLVAIPDGIVLNRLIGFEKPEKAYDYYKNYFEQLLNFYKTAAETNDYVVIWND